VVQFSIAGLLLTWLFIPWITQANAERIKPGMTLYQVERLLGKASGNYSSHIPDGYFIWKGYAGWIRVGTTEGVVTRAEFDSRFTLAD
jgi:hypothetical protein